MNTSELFRRIDRHLLEDPKPSEFLSSLTEGELSDFPFSMLQKLKNTPQSPLYHPEGSAWNHTLLVVDQAAARKEKSRDPRVFMWAALLHDIGKPQTTRTRKGRITSYNHETVGAEMARRFLETLGEEEAFIKEVTALVRWHMQPLHVVKSLPFANIREMLKDTAAEEVALLGLCDRLGRTGVDQAKEENDIQTFLEKVHAALSFR